MAWPCRSYRANRDELIRKRSLGQAWEPRRADNIARATDRGGQLREVGPGMRIGLNDPGCLMGTYGSESSKMAV